MATLIIDCDGVIDAKEFWDRYERSVGMQNSRYFGRNFDALWDALEGGGPGWPDASHLIFKNADELEALKTASGLDFLKALREIAAKVSTIKVEIA